MENPFILRQINNSDNDMLTLNYKNTTSNNVKRILCHNKLISKICRRRDNCMYAHSYNEQKQDPYKKIVYDMIKNNDRLDDFDLIKDSKIYDTVLQLTKICSKCIRNSCVGGYNCKFGVFHPKYQICYNDMYYGNCTDDMCMKVHLSIKGLVPYKTQLKKTIKLPKGNVWNNTPESVFIPAKQIKKIKNYEGTLLSNKYFLENSTITSDSSSSESDSEIQKTISYLNGDDDLNFVEDNESIFIE